jgi:sporulation protein YlmC with PRC-barrel domain
MGRFRWAALPRAARIAWLAVVWPIAGPNTEELEMPVPKQGGRGKSTSPDTANAHLLGVQSLVANKLYDTEGNFVGRLEEMVLDVRTGCVRHVVVAVGGFFGIGRQRYAVPWSALQPDARYCRAVIDLAQLRLTGVRIHDDDPWLRNPSAAGSSGFGLPGIQRSLGMGD